MGSTSTLSTMGPPIVLDMFISKGGGRSGHQCTTFNFSSEDAAVTAYTDLYRRVCNKPLCNKALLLPPPLGSEEEEEEEEESVESVIEGGAGQTDVAENPHVSLQGSLNDFD